LTKWNLQLLRARLPVLPKEMLPDAQRVLGFESEIIKRFSALYKQRLTAMRIRIHGDYHLGQILDTGKILMVVDFEGEPARPLSERRLKRSPLRDVVGLIRSFRYATYAAQLKQVELGNFDAASLGALPGWVRGWYHWVGALFLQAYRRHTQQAAFLPQNDEEWRVLLEIHLLEKMMGELGHELEQRIEWLPLPLEGILELIDSHPI
jgi:maltose alpha-D-glucosyltransferase / alpha-amylase